MIKSFPLLVLISFVVPAYAQDTTKVLEEVLIQAYQYDRPLNEVPAAVATIEGSDFQRFNTTSFLPAINTVPGVKMEERSPGSYRLSIRGSGIRSPFGIRNVKVYWNDLPFTDPGGNTYLNLMDNHAVQSMEVLKGPGSSLYGAGTGGVLFLKNSTPSNTGIAVSASGGSYGLMRYAVNALVRADQSDLRITYANQQSDGYRDHTRMARDVIQVLSNFYAGSKSTLSAQVLYTDLFYQTPGGLNETQFRSNPKQARPSAGPVGGADEQRAAVSNKTFYSGLTYEYNWNSKWSNKTGVYGSFTQFDNPTFLNYERRAEQSYGGRTNTQYRFKDGKLNFGAEYQHGFSPVKVYENNQGETGALNLDDEITTRTYFVFAQSEFFLPADLFLTLGASVNKLDVGFSRFSDMPALTESRNFDAVFLPRAALLKKINPNLSAYVSYSRGYSPPTIAELYPSAGFFDKNLNSERGDNFDIGIRAEWFKTLSLNLTAYDFQLRETIVNRRDTLQEGGPEYFVNAGVTNQRGVEALLVWQPQLPATAFVSGLKCGLSYTWNDYTFAEYTKDTIPYAGNLLPGVTPHALVAAIDLQGKAGWYINVTANYNDHIPLNDANTVYASEYVLLGARAGYKMPIRNKWPFEVFAGIENALDERYSLGNDLNAFGGRYYNTAPGRNYYAGISMTFTSVKEK